MIPPPRGTFWIATDSLAHPAWADTVTVHDGTTWGACGLWLLWLALVGQWVEAPQQMSLFEELEEVA